MSEVIGGRGGGTPDDLAERSGSYGPRAFDLLIFDWDGTLSDSAQLIVDTMQRAIVALQLPPREDERIRELIGLGLVDGMRRLYPELDTERVLALLDNYRKHWLGLAGNAAAVEAPLFAGALEVLQRLHADGYRLAVATGKSRAGLDRSLRAHPAVKALLTISRCADETANKPDPLMLSEILAELDVAPERALMIGDTEYDAAMARSIGMPMLGVACGVHDAGRIRRAGARAVVPAVADLPGWLVGKTG